MAWFAIWLATDRQVTQWINYLRRIAAAYRSGHYAIRPDLAEAPVEFKLLGDALSEMAEGIQDRDRRLREAVERENHPDQGNPPPGEEQSPDRDEPALHPGQPGARTWSPRDALMQAQTRINALALVHRILNELEDQTTLDIKQLLEELSHQIAGGMGNEQCAGRSRCAQPGGVGQRGGGAGAVHGRGAHQHLQACLIRTERQGVIRVAMAPAAGGKLQARHRR